MARQAISVAEALRAIAAASAPRLLNHRYSGPPEGYTRPRRCEVRLEIRWGMDYTTDPR
jgi:hypothetical protein